MKILLNGAWRELPVQETDLARLLQQLGYGQAVVATALNGEFVPSKSRDSITVHEGDRIEVLAPMQGG
jgi:sulfur carrier protein